MEFITVALATFTILMFALGVLPFRLPAKIMPVATSLLAWGCTELYAKLPVLVNSAAIAGSVAVVTRYAVVQLPQPVSLDDLLGRVVELVPRRMLESTRSRPKRALAESNLPGRRVPRL